ncbi:MAG: GGDEF domain-containing protein [Butyrivibrio sp.]|nr:GGDEF domain-containing protein [Butyrivibrio sp.]
MNFSDLFSRVMHFLVHNGFLFTVSVMGMVHAVLLLIMFSAGVTPLVQFNVFSVIVYIFCFLLCRFGHILPVYVSIVMEVTAYTIISTYYLGLRCGTYCFLFSIVPIIIYFGSFLFKGIARWHVALMLALNFLVFAILYITFIEKEPVYQLDSTTRLGLVLFSSFVMVFSTVFYNTIYIYASEKEVGSLEEKNMKLAMDAQEDSLTRLLNRRGFMPILEDLMADEKTSKFCIAFCDIDNFKRINDSYGHEAGDEVLRHITWIVKRQMDNCDICRWGGEEIVILMREMELATAREHMEELREYVEASPTFFFNKRIYTTMTIGIAENKESYEKPEDIIKVADSRMYYGKQHGKNVVIYEDRKTV